MRFVDEFRDADKAHALAAKIAALCEPGPSVQAHGGVRRAHPHDLQAWPRGLPAGVRHPGARSRLPRVRDPDGTGRRRDPPGRAARRDHDLIRRHDARAGKPRIVLRRQGPGHRHPHGLLAAGLAEDRQAEPGQAGRLHGDRVRDDRAVHRDDHAPRRRRGADELLGVLQPRHDHPGDQGHPGLAGPAARRLHRPGHVSTVIGCRPYEFIARDYGKPVVVAGFEPLDILQSIYMLMLQLSQGRSEVENQYSRVVPWNGNVVALKAIGETMELRPYFEWRGLGFISHSALKVREKFAAMDAELLFEVPGVRVADPKACQCGEVLKGVLKPWECKVFGTACTPETPIGTCMVSPEGACAAYYNYGRMHRNRVPEAAAGRP